MIFYREWVKRKGHCGRRYYRGYFLFGFIPLFIAKRLTP